jgi:DNA-binding transcriptional LysR family regulator
MSAFPGGEIPRPRTPGDVAPEPAGLELYTHIEGLCGEEDRLLEIAEEERDQAQHERLRAITAELDRIGEHLRERADRLRHRRTPAQDT